MFSCFNPIINANRTGSEENFITHKTWYDFKEFHSFQSKIYVFTQGLHFYVTRKVVSFPQKIFFKNQHTKKRGKRKFLYQSPKKVKPLLIWHNWRNLQLPAIPGKNALKEVTERSLECLLLRNDVNLAKKKQPGGGGELHAHYTMFLYTLLLLLFIIIYSLFLILVLIFLNARTWIWLSQTFDVLRVRSHFFFQLKKNSIKIFLKTGLTAHHSPTP